MSKTRTGQEMNYANHNTGWYNGAPHGNVQRTAGRKEEGSTRGTSGAMQTRDNKEPMQTIWVTTREPTVAAGGFPGEGGKGNGDEHKESRTVNMARGTAWEGMRTSTAIARG